MRILVTLLLAAVVLQGTLAVTSKSSQAKLMIEKINNNLEKTHLGRALKNMVHLASKLGYDYSDLDAAFDQLKDQLLERKQDAIELYADQTANHNVAVETITSAINTLTGEIENTNARILFDQGELVTFHGDWDRATAANLEAHENKDDAEQSLADAEELHAHEVSEFAKADALIDLAVTALEEAQEHFESAQIGDAFVQMKSKFVSFSQKLKEATSKFSAKHQLFIQPVVQMLAQLKTSQSAIQVATEELKKLKTYFLEAATDENNLFVSFKTFIIGAIAELSEQIRIYESETIPTIESNITAAEQDLSDAQNKLSNDTQSLAEANNALIQENATFQAATDLFNAVVAKADQEYALVVQAQQIIHDAQANQI